MGFLVRDEANLTTWSFPLLQHLLANTQEMQDILVVFGDEDFITAAGQRYKPKFQSQWNYELFL